EAPKHELSSEELLEIFGTLNAAPLLTAQNIRMSLAGAQKKLALIRLEDKFYLPEKHQVTTHILKPPHPRLPHTVENEFFCMRLGRILLGLSAPVEIFNLKNDFRILVLIRYDRELEIKNGFAC